jgi:hypothetical protein
MFMLATVAGEVTGKGKGKQRALKSLISHKKPSNQ